MRITVLFSICLILAFFAPGTSARQAHEIVPEILIETIIDVDTRQRQQISNVVFDVEYIEGETGDDGEFREKVRFIKSVYIKNLSDTTLYHEEYLEYYLDSQLQNDEEKDKEAAGRKKIREKRGIWNISFSIMKPFYPEQRHLYQINYIGVTSEPIDGYICHHFRIDSFTRNKQYINGDYYFETASFHLVRVDFTPSELVKGTMFKLRKLDLSIRYGPTFDGLWLPRQYDIQGRGLTTFFFDVEFAGTEYYRNPQINKDLDNSIFEVEDDRN